MSDVYDIRLRWAGSVVTDHRDTILDALKLRMDHLLAELALGRMDYYARGDWRGDLHRRRIANDLRATRNAIRDVQHLPARSVAA